MKTALEVLQEKTYRYRANVPIPKKLYRQDEVLLAMESYADQFKVKEISNNVPVLSSLPSDKQIDLAAEKDYPYFYARISNSVRKHREAFVEGAKYVKEFSEKGTGKLL